MSFAVRTRGLTRRFGGHVAVHPLDLDVRKGTIFGFLGLNGAGKTTTIRMLATLLAPTAGTAMVAGCDVASDPLGVRARIGLVGDVDARVSRPRWTGREYLGYFAGIQGLDLDLDIVLGSAGLPPEAAGRPLGGYSTGMRRRLEIARALLPRPELLFLDEPTRGLDLPAKRAVWDLLLTLVREQGVTVFVSSHELAEIRALCQDVAVLAEGRLSYSGPLLGLAEGQGLEQALIRLLRGGGA